MCVVFNCIAHFNTKLNLHLCHILLIYYLHYSLYDILSTLPLQDANFANRYMVARCAYAATVHQSALGIFWVTRHDFEKRNSIVGKIDSSGIRFIYTPTLRTQEAATVQVGNIYGIFVPPQADDFTIVAYCHSTCTSQVIYLQLSAPSYIEKGTCI